MGLGVFKGNLGFKGLGVGIVGLGVSEAGGLGFQRSWLGLRSASLARFRLGSPEP